MLVTFDLTAPPKETGCGKIWENYDPKVNGVDHAFCRMECPAIPHYHKDMHETYVITSGTGRVTVGSESYEVMPGSIVRIPTFVAHFTVPHGFEPLELVAVNSPAFGSFREPDFFEVLETNHDVEFVRRIWIDELNREANLRYKLDAVGTINLVSPGDLIELLNIAKIRDSGSAEGFLVEWRH